MRVSAQETREKLTEFYNEYCSAWEQLPKKKKRITQGGWRGVGYQLDMHYSSLADVAAGRPGAMSVERENQLRRRLGLSELRIQDEPCPDCGCFHIVPRCHNLNIEYKLANEKNAQPRPRKPRKSRGFDADLITLFDMERDRKGLTNSEYLAALMGVAST